MWWTAARATTGSTVISSSATHGTLTGWDGTDSVAFDFSPVDPISFTFTFTDSGMTISAPGVAATQRVKWTSVENGDIKLGEGGQTVDGSSFAGSLKVAAGGGADTLIGTGGADDLDGGTGNDFIEGAGGADLYHGGNGFDLIHARDGIADTGDCGADEDTLVADAGDAIADCERIDLPPPPPPLPDVHGPRARRRTRRAAQSQGPRARLLSRHRVSLRRDRHPHGGGQARG